MGTGLANPRPIPKPCTFSHTSSSHQWVGNLLPTEYEAFWLQEANTEFAAYAYVKDWSQKTLGQDMSSTIRSHYMMAYMFGLDPSNDVALSGSDPMAQDSVTFFLVNYVKGGTVIQSLAGKIGEDAYLQAMLALVAEHELTGGLTGDGFQAAMEDASSEDLDTFFAEWVDTPGYPTYVVDYKAASSDSGGVDITLTIDSEDDYHVPMTVAFVRPGTDEQERIKFDVEKGTQEQTVHLDFCPNGYRIDPDAQFMMAHRTRWRAMPYGMETSMGSISRT